MRFQYKYLRPLVLSDMLQILVSCGIGGFGFSAVLAICVHCMVFGRLAQLVGTFSTVASMTWPNGPALALQQSMATSLADF
jgi:hypothetical protein